MIGGTGQVGAYRDSRSPAVIDPPEPDCDPTSDDALVAGFRDAQAGWPPAPPWWCEDPRHYLLGYHAVSSLDAEHAFAPDPTDREPARPTRVPA